MRKDDTFSSDQVDYWEEWHKWQVLKGWVNNELDYTCKLIDSFFKCFSIEASWTNHWNQQVVFNFHENSELSGTGSRCILSAIPISSAGLFGRLLMKVSKASFIALTNFSFFRKHTSTTWSTLSLKSSSSWTIVLSFSGLITIVLPKVWGFKKNNF